MGRRQRPKITGITVYKRGETWSYRLDLGADPLTGDRQRENKGGFDSEDAAWKAALESQSRLEQGRHVKPSQRKVAEFLDEWLTVMKDSVKPSTYQNYVDYTGAYVKLAIGNRRLQDITVPVLNMLYRRLLASGRSKPDNNTKMYAYWRALQHQRNGRGPKPTDMAKACGTTIYAAQAAATRFRRGRIPQPKSAGLAPKTVKNIHRMLHRAFKDAVAWNYLTFNPAEHVSLPREARSGRSRPKPWTLDELAAWLRVALDDRFAGMWVLAATTGMRRSELAGVERDMLDLDQGTVTIENTRVVVKGHATDSDGKTEGSRRTISLDPFTVAALRRLVEMIEGERDAFGSSYPDHGMLMCFEDGRRLHPDTVTSRFNRLVDQAGVRRIRLHDVRHTYATLARDLGVNSKIVTDRLGHASEAVTQQIYTHPSTGNDRPAAEMIAGLIAEALGTDEADLGARWSQSWSHGQRNGPPDHLWRAVLPGSGGGI
jgi:integrase